MVAISLSHESVKEMANRLRQFLAVGGTSIKQTHAYEALAKTLGYRDWNTLLGTLDRPAAPPTLSMLLLVDRHAMAAHGVTVAQLENAFRRDFPTLLDERIERESQCFEQLPARALPPFRPPVISIVLQAAEHVHDAVMACVVSVAAPKRTFIEHPRPGVTELTIMFFPERDAAPLVASLREAFARLPADITVVSVEQVDPAPVHRGMGKWRTDAVSYFMWAWNGDPGIFLPDIAQVAALPLKFNGDALVRLRDIATLHFGIRAIPPPR